MIRLTDEEIIAGVNDGGLAEGGKLINLTAAGRKEYLGVAKAQLKNVTTNLKVIDCFGGNKLILAKDWQALLEEVNE